MTLNAVSYSLLLSMQCLTLCFSNSLSLNTSFCRSSTAMLLHQRFLSRISPHCHSSPRDTAIPFSPSFPFSLSLTGEFLTGFSKPFAASFVMPAWRFIVFCALRLLHRDMQMVQVGWLDHLKGKSDAPTDLKKTGVFLCLSLNLSVTVWVKTT